MNTETSSKFKLGDRITDLPKFTPFRSLYPVYVNETELIAFLGLNQGWGKRWQLYTLKKTTEGVRHTFQDMSPAAAHGVVSKDSALKHLEWLMETHPHRFKTRTQVLQSDKEVAHATLVQEQEYLTRLVETELEASQRVIVMLRVNTEGWEAEDLEVFQALIQQLEGDMRSAAGAVLKQQEKVEGLTKVYAEKYKD
jgi:hypothetical protein